MDSRRGTILEHKWPAAVDLRNMYFTRSKLKASAATSALLTGFAMVALVELNIDDSRGVIGPSALIFYAVCTALLVSFHLLALMMATCILPYIDAATSAIRHFSVAESPHTTLRHYIELAWFFSTVVGLFLFLVEIASIFYLKFLLIYPPAAYSALGILIPALVVFVAFAATFYYKLGSFRLGLADQKLQDLDLKLERIELNPRTPSSVDIVQFYKANQSHKSPIQTV